jgi:undecaprenyl-diphosphatase
VVVLSAAMVTVIGIAVHGKLGWNHFDAVVARWLDRHFSTRTFHAALHVTDAPVIIAVVGIIAAVAALRARWDIAALAVLAPIIATVTTELVLKPLVGHMTWLAPQVTGGTTYPSGHETAFASIAVVVAVVVIGASLHLAAKLIALLALAALVGIAAIGLNGTRHHSATDLVGAVGVALAITLLVALAIDQVSAAVRDRHRELDREPA